MLPRFPRRLLVSLLLVGCSVPFDSTITDVPGGDSGDDTADTSDTSDTGTQGDTVVRGTVLGADGLPLGGVTVTSGGDSSVTDLDGAFEVQGDAPLTVTFTRVGLHGATRSFGHSVESALVGLQPARAATGFDAAVATSLEVAGARLDVPADALGVGMVTATLDPFDLEAGIHTLPAGALDVAGNVATIMGAAVVAFDGVTGPITASTPATVRLPLTADAPGSSVTVFEVVDGAWVEAGTASVADGSATFTVTQGGVYGVGRLDNSGCISGTVVDGSGAAAPGARVRSYVRPVATGVASWVDEVEAGADGTFCVTGSATASTVHVEYTDGAGGVWMGVATTAASGTADTCTDCNEIGNVQLGAAGCAMGNLYAADGSALPVSPFAWEEGSFVQSSLVDGASSITFYARTGVPFHLRGPGGFSKAFSVSESTPEAGNCTRLGNLQAPESCVSVDVSDGAAPLAGIQVAHADGGWGTSDADGNVCVTSDDGSTTYTATRTVGAQNLSVDAAVTVDAVAGSCQSGACFAGPSLAFGEAGCVEGVLYGEGGAPAAGVTLWSSAWDSATTGSDGSYSLSTGGSGVGALWGEEWSLTTFDDQPASSGCVALDLYTDAGTPPALLVAMDKYAWQVTGGGSTETAVLSDVVVSFTDIQADTTADLLLGLLNVYAWSSDITGAGWASFDDDPMDGSDSAGFWSAVRIAPDASVVALQGYGSTNSAVWILDLAGDNVRQLSTSAGTDVDGLAFSDDSAWLASTRRDAGIEVTPVNGSRSPTTIAASPCAHPVWWDADTVALACSGDVHLYEMDGSSHVTFLTSGADERVWAITAARRVVYTADEELRIANIDLSDDQLLYAGSDGTTYTRVRVSADGVWVAAIVHDPVAGTDVVAVPDQAPYDAVWLTDTPTESETSIDWPD